MINRVNIQKFRGIIDTELILNGKNLLLKGDNGTGKTSIVSAIEFFFTGEISPLKGVQGLSIRKHASHVSFNSNDTRIEIEFNDGTLINRKLSDQFIAPNHLKDFFNSAKKQKFILHRNEILQFIISQPAQRYKAIGSILGIESLDKIELQFKRIRDDYESDYKTLINNYNHIKSETAILLNTEINTVNDILIGLNDYLKNLRLPLVSSLEGLKDYIKGKYESIIKKGESSTKIINLKEIIQLTKNFKINLKLTKIIDDINLIKEKLYSENVKTELKLKNLLENGQSLIKEEKTNICPLCEQNINYKEILKRILDRLKLIETLSNEHSILIEKLNLIFNEIRRIKENLNFLKSKILNYNEFTEFYKPIDKIIKSLEKYVKKYSDFEDYELLIEKEVFLEQISKIKLLLEALERRSNEIINEFSLSKEENKTYDAINLISQIDSKKNQMIEFELQINEIEKLFKISDKLYNYFSEIKKEKISNIYEILKEDIQRFYQIIHPDDPHKNIELEIISERRASTALKIDSFDRTGEDPRALTSEGHLDTLGVCIFLAFAKKFNKSCPFMILDDIVTTVDANHREKLAKLILNEFSEFQMIITTHDSIWYQQLCSNQRTCGVEGKFRNLRIVGWDLDTGPKILPYKARWEKIQESLNNGDFTIAGMISRRYLEWVLKEICAMMKGKIEYRRDGRYMIGELFDSAENRIKKLLKKLVNDEDFKNNILESFQNLRSSQFMGNLLAHDNPLIEELSDSEIIGFCDSVNSLYEKFLCPNCKSFIIYEREFKEIRCSSKICQNPILKKL